MVEEPRPGAGEGDAVLAAGVLNLVRGPRTLDWRICLDTSDGRMAEMSEAVGEGALTYRFDP
ncbi:hypothetical protein [Streptomyces malaysiensis]|uniref:hypothetical protein n=1 Tax=Streptomyces malaysiensis TaxID=92644 RepID=UPI00322061DA|nr:hypothetical protein [Streptomyces malaysiensis]